MSVSARAGGVLEDDAEGVGDGLVVEVADLEGHQGAGPVDRLGDRGRLLELQLAEPGDRRHQLAGHQVVEVGHLRGDDLALALGVGVVEVEVEAATLDGLGELAAGVGGEHDERLLGGRDRPELGDGDLEVRQHLQEQPLDLDVGLVDLVDEQHRRLLSPDRRQQRAGEQELLGEDVVVGLRPLLGVVAGGLDPQQLLLVVPLVQRAGLVQALVALQPHQVGARGPGHRLGQLGLADPRRTLDQEGLLQGPREVRRRGGHGIGEVPGLVQPGGGVSGRGEPGHVRILPPARRAAPAGCAAPTACSGAETFVQP
jgi:hypothetical protein